MLKGFDEDLNTIDFTLPPEELKIKLAEMAGNRATGLSDKNTELLNKNRQANELLSKGSDLTAAEKEQLKELQEFKTSAELKLAEEAGKYNDAKLMSQQNHQNDLDSLTEANKKALEDLNTKSSGFESQLKTIMVDQAITAELVKLDVSKDLIETWQDSISLKTTFTDGKAMIGEQSLSEYMKEWADSPAGKASRLAPNNNGGGANGGDNNSSNSGGNSGKVKAEAQRAAEINERFKN